MPTKLVEALMRKKQYVQFRSSDDLTIKYAMISIVDRTQDATSAGAKAVELGVLSEDLENQPPVFPPPGDDRDPKALRTAHILLAEVYDIKERTYFERHHHHHAIQVVTERPQKDTMGYDQVLLIFDTADEREHWYDGLLSLMSHDRWAKHNPQKANRLRFITNITELMPKEDEIVRLEVTVGEYAPDILSVRKDDILKEEAARKKAYAEQAVAPGSPHIAASHSSDICKELVNEFVLHNFILPAEGVSLYRYVRALISRLLMEMETMAIVREIEKLRWNAYEVQKYHIAEIRIKAESDDKKLKALGHSLKYRIGRHGPAAPLVAKLLQRSIDKTIHYNRNHSRSMLGNQGDDTGGDDE